MIKSELVQRISLQNPHLYQRDVENIVNAILGEIIAAVARGDRVELRGFGDFSVKYRPARTGRVRPTPGAGNGATAVACSEMAAGPDELFPHGKRRINVTGPRGSRRLSCANGGRSWIGRNRSRTRLGLPQ